MTQHEITPPLIGGGVSALSRHFAFNQWADERILTHIALLSEAELMEPDQTSHGSAFLMLLHMLDSEWGWRIVCQDQVKTPFLWEVESIPDFETLARFWQGEHNNMAAYLQSLADADLNQLLDYGALLADQHRSATIVDLLTHILYHSSNHRSELAAYLTRYGHSPGDIDYLDFVTQADSKPTEN